MLSVIFVLIPTAFGLFVWSAYRTQRKRAAEGLDYVPRDGARRWDRIDRDE